MKFVNVTDKRLGREVMINVSKITYIEGRDVHMDNGEFLVICPKQAEYIKGILKKHYGF